VDGGKKTLELWLIGRNKTVFVDGLRYLGNSSRPRQFGGLGKLSRG